MGSYSVVEYIRYLMGQPFLFSHQCWRVGREATVMAPPPRMTQQYRLASMAAWLSSMGISYHNLLPHISLICLSTVNTSPGIAPQSLKSSFQPLCLLGDLPPCLGYAWL